MRRVLEYGPGAGNNQAVNQKGMLNGERENSECISGSKTNFRTQNAGMNTKQRVFRRMESAGSDFCYAVTILNYNYYKDEAPHH